MVAINGIVPWTMVSSTGTNLTQVTGQSCMLCVGSFGNVNGNPRFVKLFDTVAAPTLGVTVPVFNAIIPGNVSGSGSNIPIPQSRPFAALQFLNGLWIAVTANIALLDNTGISSGDVCINLGYITIAVPT
jgi:hypothetical protein